MFFPLPSVNISIFFKFWLTIIVRLSVFVGFKKLFYHLLGDTWISNCITHTENMSTPQLTYRVEVRREQVAFWRGC
jgi:hypothetical protein